MARTAALTPAIIVSRLMVGIWGLPFAILSAPCSGSAELGTVFRRERFAPMGSAHLGPGGSGELSLSEVDLDTQGW